MKSLIIVIFLLYPVAIFSQKIPFTRHKTDSIVLQIDNDRKSITYGFQQVSTIQKNKVLINYQYWLRNGRLTKIKRSFNLKNESHTQIHYLHNGSLIFSVESIPFFYKEGTVIDTIMWSGIYYFLDLKLVDYETLGHGKSETEEWDPETEVLSNFKLAKMKVLGDLRKRRTTANNGFPK